MNEAGCPEDELLGRLAEGDLSPPERSLLLGHVEGCEACMAALVASAGEASPALRPGDRAGRYQIVSLLGTGAMGAVYRARDQELERDVALKVVHPARRGEGELHERLIIEARALAQVSSPHVVSVFDVGRVEGRQETFLSMELIEGQTLRAWLASQERSADEIVTVFLQAGEGLAAAHAAGVIHRDVKPDNILVGADGRARIGDFGLARAAAPGPIAGRGGTTLGAGTPAYMAPEQLRGEAASARSDQYAYCLSLLEALTGERPGPSAVAGAASKLAGPLRRALLRGLSPRPDDRWPSIDALTRALAPRRGGRLRWAAAGAAALLLGAWMNRASLKDCRAGAVEVEPVWGPARAAELRGALGRLGATEGAMAASEAALSGWRGAWVKERDVACRARVAGRDPAAAAREACLANQREQIDAFVGAVVRGEVKSAEGAVRAAQALPAPGRCAAAEQGDAESPEARALARRLALATAQRWARGGAQARAETEAVMEKSEQAGLRRLSTRARVELGLAYLDSSELARARDELRRASEEARERGDTLDAIDATLALLEALASDGALHLTEVLGGLVGAELKRIGGDPEREAALLRTRCIAAERAGKDLEQGLAICRRARDTTLALHGPDDLRLSRSENRLGDVLWRLNRLDEAEAHFKAALAIDERMLGPEAPGADHNRANIAFVWLEQGRPAEAERVFREQSAKNPEDGNGHDSIAMARRAVGDFAGEVDERRVALRLCLAQGYRLCQLWQRINLGVALAEIGLPDEAEAQMDEAEALGLHISVFDQTQMALARGKIALGRGETKRGCASLARARGTHETLPPTRAVQEVLVRLDAAQARCPGWPR